MYKDVIRNIKTVFSICNIVMKDVCYAHYSLILYVVLLVLYNSLYNMYMEQSN